MDNGSGIGDHENLDGAPTYDEYNDCEAKYYVVRRVETHQPWDRTEAAVLFTRLSDPGYPTNPTYLTVSEIAHSLYEIDSRTIAIPVEFR